MMKYHILAATLLAPASIALPSAAYAGDTGPIMIDEGVTLDPMLDARLRYERVDQDNIGLSADALTIRMRPGLELAFADGLSFLAEAEATLGIINDYNSTTNGKAGAYSVVADPQNIELNRLQINYKPSDGSQITMGRQRINIDDQRFVGSVGWRQNEQTFDAVRVQSKLFDVLAVDGTYAISQRSIFGIDAGNRQSMDGNFYFAGAGIETGPVSIKGFAYLIDYDAREAINANSSQTYGVRATAAIPVGPDFKIDLAASYATQSDYGGNVLDYSADYIAASIGTSIMGFGLTGGYEELGASDNPSIAFRTPLATLHKFNGWADSFLTTPANGLRDYYVTVGKKISGIKMLPGLNASVTYHEFDADRSGPNYGSEWDAQLGFKIDPIGVQIKYANYNAKAFGTDTEKLWLQLGYSF
ncbi:alginate export family protein [Parasphingorhabdus sp.]|uniref:alginate export family protein n=1 Tax=Parasphingorhabdus sp. TaxID=2709688 RepID=UPI003A937C8B